MSATPDLRGSPSTPDLDRALAPSTGSEWIARFLDAIAPDDVLRAVRRCLPPGGPDPVLRLVRAKLRPGHKLTAEYGVLLPPLDGVERRVAVTWVAPGASAPGPGTHAEADALRRGVLAPFHRAWIGSDDRRMSMSVSPVDDAFPHLVRLHDRAHLVELLEAAGATAGDVAAEDVTVEAIRYRPRQRHVLRVGTGPGRAAWFLKVYRDDAGRHAVDAAARAATVLAAGGNGNFSSGGGTYLTPDRTALWPEVAGAPLTDVLVMSGAEAAVAVRTAGRALRLLHDAPPGDDLPIGPDAGAQAAETVRTAQLVQGLLPPVGAQLCREVGRALDVLSRLPREPPTLTHGDFKCDNLVLNGHRLHLLDFDRFRRGDPAADIGKFLADLRWWAGTGGHPVEPLHAAFVEGYGVREPARLARARAYDALLQLRMAARRVPVQDPDWGRRVADAVAVAAVTLAEEPFP